MYAYDNKLKLELIQDVEKWSIVSLLEIMMLNSYYVYCISETVQARETSDKLEP